jgi:hypothetical protein
MQMPQVFAPAEESYLREFGSVERFHWLMGLNHSNHFAMAVEVSGETTPSMWREALNKLCHRHPFLNVRIARNAKSKLVFQRVDGNEIPLTVKALESPFQWQEEFENELVTLFDPYSAPLMRALLLHNKSKCVMILTTHHTIADGMSLVFVIRDLMQAMSGQTLAALSVPPSQEEIFSQMGAVSSPVMPESHAGPAATATLPERPVLNRGRLQVHGLRLTPEQTTQVVSAARHAQTTVHAALCAALVLAGREISPSWRDGSVQVLTPINLRKTLNAGDDCAIRVAGAIVPFDQTPVENFWELARWTKQSLVSAQDARGQALPSFIERVIANDDDSEALAQLFSLGIGYDLVVTNVQRMPFANRFGDFTVEAVWGPAALNGLEGEQAVAVATVNDSLCLVHTSYTPFPLLLEKATQLLLRACS